MEYSMISEKLNKLPTGSGVYIFRNKSGRILYIGKATSLKNRVQSYFRGADRRGVWIAGMVNQIADIDFAETDSVLEALILESNLIKKHQPKYNTDLKDDKSFVCVALTKENFPKFVVIRQSDLNKNDPLRQVEGEASKFPMTNDKSNPKSKIQNLVQFKKTFGPYTSKRQLEIALKIIRRIFPYHSSKQLTEKGCLDFQLGLCPGPYASAISKIDYKKNIRSIEMILEGKKKNLVVVLEKEMKIKAKKHEFEKAAELRNKIFALKHIQDVALISSEPPLKPPLKKGKRKMKKLRIEAYDISNISGTDAVGSMVVFAVPRDSVQGFYGENGEPNKKEYRKFKIKTVVGIDDVGMMREVLLRRFQNDWPMPDLILLDGGQGHANAIGGLAQEFGLDVLIVAVAKGKARKNLNFQFPISNKFSMTQFPKEIQNFLDNKNLVKQIMDEAHRFAISYHRKLRKKSFI